jgi:hypothetical protein
MTLTLKRANTVLALSLAVTVIIITYIRELLMTDQIIVLAMSSGDFLFTTAGMFTFTSAAGSWRGK